MKSARCLAFAVLVLAGSSELAAQRLAAQKQGFSAGESFALGDIDSVSLFNSSLTIRVPLASFPVGPELSYAFTLTGSSRGWKHDLVFCNPGGDKTLQVPEPNHNAGWAFALHFGRLQRPEPGEPGAWIYIGPAGSRTGFYGRIHPNYPASTSSTVYYTNNSAYLRLREFSSGAPECASPSGDCLLLEFPSGVVHEFLKFNGTGYDEHRLVQMRDPFGNTVDFSYDPTKWQISDSEGRQHEITFAGPSGEYKRVKQVKVAKFGAGQSSYVFEYGNRTFRRQDFVPATCPSEPEQVAVITLDRLIQPDDSYYEFAYYTDDDLAGDVLSGGLKSLRLPTGGEMRWTYTRNVIRSQDREFRQDFPFSVTQGVATKEIALSPGGPAIGTWTYDNQPANDVRIGQELLPCHRTTTVTDPGGNQSVHYFTTSLSHRWSYGLPFTRCEGGTYDPTGPFLSSEVYEGTVATGTKLRSVYVEYESDGLGMGGGEDNQEKNSRLIYTKAVYHDDGDNWKATTWSDFDGVGHFRQVSESVSWNVEDGHQVNTNWNPGRGTLVVDPETGDSTGSTLILPPSTGPWILDTFDSRQVAAANEVATQEFCFDTATGFLERTRVLAARLVDGGGRSNIDLLTVFEQEEAAGRSTGRVATENRYGGDTQGTMDSVYDSLCDMTLPAQPQYQTEHTYQAGVRATSTAVDPTCSPPREVLSLLDQTIDTNTGLVSRSRDTAGVETVFTYDVLGRLTSERTADGAWTTYTYQLPSQTEPNRPSHLTVKACANGSSSCTADEALTWQRLEYDELGRLVTERIRLPGTSGLLENARTTTYNAQGWKLTESVWGNAGKVTTYDNYDALGRVGRITPPGQEAVEIFYGGDRVKTRKTRVMLTSGLGDAYTTEIYDARGRLIRVCEDQSQDWSGTCPGIETSYLYDVGERLTRVCSNRQVVGGATTCGQIRRFVYDNRGFLLQERHPEIGILEPPGTRFSDVPIVDPDGFEELESADAGNDWIFYTYDARGNVLTKDVERTTDFDLNYAYDAAGRLIRVEEARNGSPRPLKEFYYARANLGTDLRKGKLVLTKRHNWLAPPGSSAPETDAIVSQVFQYEGLNGSISSRQTRYQHEGTTYAFDYSITLDPLGNVATLTYPQCRHGEGGCAQAAPSRTVSFTRAKGYLTAIPGYASTITYQAGGTLRTITFASGVTYTLEINPSDGLDRPYRISTTAGWNSGIYRYDGAGNITQIGSQLYRYDRLNRLVSGQVLVGGSLRTQTASYDVYGNITSLVTNGSTQSTSTSTETNRLLSPLGTYDGAGNLIQADFGSKSYDYTYDGANMMKTLKSDAGLERLFLYSADDERVAQLDCVIAGCALEDTRQTWTIRGTASEVLRVYTRGTHGGWEWKTDYIHRSGKPFASVSQQGVLHLHPDHLGTPRQITDSTGSQESFHSYYPFGQEATSAAQDEVVLKFTGHERDNDESDNNQEHRADLDYMHARYYHSSIGKFFVIDPIDSSKLRSPQTWNKYSYVRSNPMLRVDPDGKGDRLSFRAGGDPDNLVELVEREGGTESGAALGALALAAAPSSILLVESLASRFAFQYAFRAGALGGIARLVGRFSPDSSVQIRRQGVDFLKSAARGASNLKDLAPGQRRAFADQFIKVANNALNNSRTPNLRRRVEAFIFNRERARFFLGQRKTVPKNAKQTTQEFAEEVTEIVKLFE